MPRLFLYPLKTLENPCLAGSVFYQDFSCLAAIAYFCFTFKLYNPTYRLRSYIWKTRFYIWKMWYKKLFRRFITCLLYHESCLSERNVLDKWRKTWSRISHLKAMSYFYINWKHQKTRCFWMFSRVMEMEHLSWNLLPV